MQSRNPSSPKKKEITGWSLSGGCTGQRSSSCSDFAQTSAQQLRVHQCRQKHRWTTPLTALSHNRAALLQALGVDLVLSVLRWIKTYERKLLIEVFKNSSIKYFYYIWYSVMLVYYAHVGFLKNIYPAWGLFAPLFESVALCLLPNFGSFHPFLIWAFIILILMCRTP